MPFLLVRGDVEAPQDTFIVVSDTVRYKCESVIVALFSAFKIYIALEAQYPKGCSQVWLFLQKVLFRLDYRHEKLQVASNKALTYFSIDLQLPLQ